jgi:hypothetical protein
MYEQALKRTRLAVIPSARGDSGKIFDLASSADVDGPKWMEQK